MKKSLWTALYVGIGILLFVIQGGFPTYTNAQTSIEDAARININDIDVSPTPEVPGAFEKVTFKVQSYLTDVNRAFIIWKLDGKIALSGTGAKQFSITTGDVGQKTIVDFEMLLVTGEVIKKKFIVNPAEINVVWEGADAYTPPFYRGRALPSSEGFIRILAIPQIQGAAGLGNIDNYVFTWKRNDKILQNGSGYNKSALIVQQDYLNEEDIIEVTGQDNDTGARANGKLSLSVFPGKILLYDRDPIYGIDWAHELGGSLDVSNADKTILAVPYFFSPKNPLSNSLKYTWSINDATISTPAIKNMLTIKSGQSKGIAAVKLKIEATMKLFLEAQRNIVINLK